MESTMSEAQAVRALELLWRLWAKERGITLVNLKVTKRPEATEEDNP